MKKNIWILALAVTALFAACSKNDDPTTNQDSQEPEQTVTENDFEGPNGEVVVQLGALSTPSAIITRGTGVITGTDITVLDNLGIFALAQGATYTADDIINWGTEASNNNCILMNVKAKGTATDPYDTEVHGTTVKRLTLFDPKATTDGAVYYYPMQGAQNYNFHGYFPRQDDSKVKITNGEVYVEFSGLIGDDDIITGVSTPAPVITSLYEDEKNLTPTTGLSLNGYNAKYIRKIKYSNWIIDQSNSAIAKDQKHPFIPSISFDHKLTKLNFQIITAQKQADGTDIPYNDRVEAAKLRISDIVMTDISNQANLKVSTGELEWNDASTAALDMIKANPDATFTVDGTTTNLWDKKTIGATTKDVIAPQLYKTNEELVQTPYISAGYLMVRPQNNYTITLNIIANLAGATPQIQSVTLPIKLANNNPFAAGSEYDIRIGVYALQAIFIDASLKDWNKSDENVDVDIE